MADDDAIAALGIELRERLGDAAVRDDDTTLDRATADGSSLSPVIRSMLPLGRAQLVVFPGSAEDVAIAVGAAVRHRVPITPRGRGTANYGQTIPMAGGLVIDLSRMRTILGIGEGWIRCEPGVTLLQIEREAAEHGQQVLMYPSTAYSTIGGFVSGGSGGTGSIRHGMLHTGFVTALDVVHGVPDAALVHLEGEATEPYLHKYGTVGVIVSVTVRLEPLQDWRAFLASFDDFGAVRSVLRQVSALEPTPRLVSGDPAELAAALPSDPAIPAGRASLRAILDVAAVPEATRLVEAAGGRVEDVREGVNACLRLSMTSYNHPIEWLQKAEPDTWFHVEVIGDGLIDRHDELVRVYDRGMLHLEGQRGRPIGMLAGHYSTPEEVFAGFERIEALGIGFHNPHQWYVDYEPDATRALAATTDPYGLLNPGKLVPPLVRTGSQR